MLTWASPDGAYIELYLQTADDADIAVRTPPGAKTKVVKDFVHPLTHQVVVGLEVDSGAGELSIFSKAGKNIVGDAYISGYNASFNGSCLSAGKLIGALAGLPRQLPSAATISTTNTIPKVAM